MADDHNQDLADLVEAARTVIADDGSDPTNALELADRVLNLHDSLSKGGPLPDDWMSAVRAAVMEEMQREHMAAQDAGLLMIWMLNQTPEGVITIPARELVAPPDTVLEKFQNPFNKDLTFRIVHKKDKPNLTLVKEN